jgi:hypothetical protein
VAAAHIAVEGLSVVCAPNPPLLTACALSLLLAALPASADTPTEAAAAARAEAFKPFDHPVDTSWRMLGSVEIGRGLRFNNPYRLSTQLGTDAQSVSLTASYLDFGLGVAFGPPNGLQHGAALHASIALAGVGQVSLTPTYLLAYRASQPFLAYGRVGPSFLLTPDPTIGAEVAGGFAWFLTGKVAIASELVFDLYYGAGTYDVGIATYPILSGQLGLLIEHEILP